MSAGLSTGVAADALRERKNDLYETPPEAVVALVHAEGVRMPRLIWEPACGPGSIVRSLRDCGKGVIGTDLVKYDWAHESGVDFLMERSAPEGMKGIVTNPPFKNAADFVRKALTLVPYTAMLMRLAFLESEARSDILDGGELSRVYVFRNRLPMMHREGWAGKRITSGAVAFAWFIWDCEHKGPTTIQRISWKP